MNSKITKTLLASACLLLSFFLLAYFVKFTNVSLLNIHIYKQLIHFSSPLLTNAMICISMLGNGVLYVLVILILIIIPHNRRIHGIPLALILIFSVLCNHIVKEFLAIPRPHILWLVSESGFGFPSNHTMSAMTFVGFLCFFISRTRWSSAYKNATYLIAFIYVILMGISRIYLGVHNFTDVLGAYLLSLSVLFFCISIYLLVEAKFPKAFKRKNSL